MTGTCTMAAMRKDREPKDNKDNKDNKSVIEKTSVLNWNKKFTYPGNYG